VAQCRQLVLKLATPKKIVGVMFQILRQASR
jgi:hypothetical protein